MVTPLIDAIHQWHLTHDTLTTIKLCENLDKLSQRDQPIRFASGFSGCEIEAQVLHELCAYWRRTFGVTIKYELQFVCDSGPQQQQFLADEHDPPIIFANMKELGGAYCCYASLCHPNIFKGLIYEHCLDMVYILL